MIKAHFGVDTNDGFNRTFMELKLKRMVGNLLRAYVLIVPLWNWNWTERGRTAVTETVLIVPLWNWNEVKKDAKGDQQASFNRTFMELKLINLYFDSGVSYKF